MPPDSTMFSSILNDPVKLATILAPIITLLVGLIPFLPKLKRKWQNYRDRLSLQRRIGAELYTPEDILRATEYYIRPDCQDVDPTDEAEIRLVHGVKHDLFETVNDMLANPTKYKYIIVLADSGMGKTSFVLNYYLHHSRHRRQRKKFNLALIPLGIKNASDYIKKIPAKKNTTLFLDAFDEDSEAIRNHRMRLKKILDISREFRQILITSRTQFFPREEEIPKQTGIIRVGVTGPGEPHEYLFYKLYLSPFSDGQVEQYLKKRFSIWRWHLRSKARRIIGNIPLLTVRPMLLAHIKELIQSKKSFDYSFQLYEAMVHAWLVRELPFVPKKDDLRRFSEKLAIDLYEKSEKRGAERIPGEELEPLAQQFKINLKGWQLRGRSLLNRDAVGNYKFAHRSIMEYLFVKQFLELKPEHRPKIVWTDQMKKFIVEILYYCQENRKRVPNLYSVDLSGIGKYRLRSSSKTLSRDEVSQMLVHFNFSDKYKNRSGKGIKHQYLKIGDKEAVIFDLATGLMWQQGGSPDTMKFEAAKNWVDELNRKGYSGYNDWRLPTLEEAMSLMDPRKHKGLYIDPIFDRNQSWIWTSNPYQGAAGQWVVGFDGGGCSSDYLYDDFHVRAVRFGQSSP